MPSGYSWSWGRRRLVTPEQGEGSEADKRKTTTRDEKRVMTDTHTVAGT